MSLTINERPYRYCFSRNEIRYVFTLDNLTRVGLYLQIKIMYQGVNDTVANEMPPFKLKPNTDGTVYFPMQAYIDSLLSYVLPSANDMVTNANNQCCKFWVEYREIKEGETNPAYVTTEESYKRLAIKGGISKNKFSRNNFFTNYFDSNNPFFTWQPQGRMVFIDQPLFLTGFLPIGNTTGYTIVVTCYTIDGDNFSEGYDIGDLDGVLFHFNLNQVIAQQPALSYTSFSFKVLNVTNDIVLSSYSINIQYRPLYSYQDIIFHNSTGGIDTVRVRGEIEQGIEKQYEETQGGFANNESLAGVKSYELKHRAITYANTFKGDVGFLNTKQEQDAMIELLISKSIYQYKDSRYIPILNIQKATPTRKSSDELFSFPIDITSSMRNEDFTPENVMLGIGDLND